jgi:hypothetical protein
MPFKKPDFGNLLNVLGLAGICLALFVFWPAKCQAGNATLTWTHPAAYEDGTALALANIARTEIAWGVCNAGKTDIAGTPTTFNVAAPAATAAIPAIPTGSYCFKARTVTTANEISAWAGPAAKDVTNIPGKPQNFTVTISP